MPSRAGSRPATDGRNIRCIAGGCRCCSTRRSWSASGRTRCGPAIASPVIATMPTAASPRLVESADGDVIRRDRRAADRRRRPAFGRARADASRPAADPVGRRHHVARHQPGHTDPHRRVLRRLRHAPAPASSSIRSRRPIRRPAWRPSTGSPRSRSTTPKAGSNATGTSQVAIDEFHPPFRRTGPMTGSTCRR